MPAARAGILSSMAIHARRRSSLRLPGFRYESNGAYYITICTSHRRPIFGDIRGDQVIPNEYGKIVMTEWHKSFDISDAVMPDEVIVMPDHMHAIVWFSVDNAVGLGSGAPSRSHETTRADPRYVSQNLSALVRDFKGAITRRLAGNLVPAGKSVWQRGFYDRIIRPERELVAIREYIRYNAMKCRM
jgi:REP element-mobilizing transposase RayT